MKNKTFLDNELFFYSSGKIQGFRVQSQENC